MDSIPDSSKDSIREIMLTNVARRRPTWSNDVEKDAYRQSSPSQIPLYCWDKASSGGGADKFWRSPSPSAATYSALCELYRDPYVAFNNCYYYNPKMHMQPQIPIPSSYFWDNNNNNCSICAESLPFSSTTTSAVTRLRHMITKQIEYYFSDDNLARDWYLKMFMDDEGWVPITLIAGFKRVRKLSKDTQFVLDSLIYTTTLEVQGEKVRRQGGWKKWVLPEALRRVLMRLYGISDNNQI